jgi:HAMP domain-containing protein
MTPGQRAAADLGMGSSVWMGLSSNHASVAWGRVINSLTTLRPIGYYMIYVNENALYEMFGGIKFSGARELFLMDADGTIISHRNKELLGTRADSGYASRVLFGGNQGFFEAKVDGRASYVAYHMIKKTGWRIVSVIPAAQYDTQIIVLRNSMFVIALVCLIVISLFAVLLAAGLSRPIQALTSVVVRVRDGDIDIRSDYESSDEVGILSENFNQMIGQINTADLQRLRGGTAQTEGGTGGAEAADQPAFPVQHAGYDQLDGARQGGFRRGGPGQGAGGHDARRVEPRGLFAASGRDRQHRKLSEDPEGPLRGQDHREHGDQRTRRRAACPQADPAAHCRKRDCARHRAHGGTRKDRYLRGRAG